MVLVRAPENDFIRIVLSLLVLFPIDFSCNCFTVESPAIIMQGRFYARCWDWFAQWFLHFHIVYQPDLEPLFLHYYENYWHGSCHRCFYLNDWYWASCGFYLTFFTSYYGTMIFNSCGYLYIIFTLMLGLGAIFGVFGRYVIWMLCYMIWKIVQ